MLSAADVYGYRGTDHRVHLLSPWEFTVQWGTTRWNEPYMSEEKYIALKDSGDNFTLEPGRDF
eukprot:11538669-Karenia_brevis.AAC.1